MSELSYRVIPPEMVPDDMREKVAFISGKADEYERCRALAFGAIRRAVEGARWCDKEAAFWSVLNSDYSDEYTWCAFSIRRAIRAAIGSDKT